VERNNEEEKKGSRGRWRNTPQPHPPLSIQEAKKIRYFTVAACYFEPWEACPKKPNKNKQLYMQRTKKM
jgi:hypothetical protein